MASKKKVIKKEAPKLPRQVADEDFEVRDLQWAAGIKCPCGRGLDFFVRYQPHEMVCPNCNRYYEIKLVGYEVEKPQ